MNYHGDWIVGYCRYIGYCSVLHAELWGVLDGLQTAWKYGANRVMLEMDNAEAFTMLSSPCHNHEATVVRRIRELMHMDWSIELSLICREANVAADALARYGYSSAGELSEFQHPSEALYSILQADNQAWRNYA
ncbi:hypothetical protein F3Y22_tig00111877pilonHSYRG00155 [Hibiscus syriacus]|uniref:RNase H type-1 domain-containing protein n=1 Tax=Hibiscus syriacus TaxID=106335 RepID=A0A6A2Y6K6_HIBSY|nr:hypothetical protein F3Y22_tig00111877pilonHSYRG00155 [Hibiscus syriacus]